MAHHSRKSALMPFFGKDPFLHDTIHLYYIVLTPFSAKSPSKMRLFETHWSMIYHLKIFLESSLSTMEMVSNAKIAIACYL